jgi:hypothetical protein
MADKRPINVHTMLRHCDVGLALKCFNSLIKFSCQPLSMVIHDDGSLTRDDSKLLSDELPGSKIIFKQEADAIMEAVLKPYPNAYKFRQDDIFSLKLLDIPLMEKDDIAYCDCDIMFFRPFDQLFSWPDEKTSAIFMMDPFDECYSIRPWHLLGQGALKLSSSVNVGLIFFRKRAYDLDYVEWFLEKKEFRKIPIARWVEPTCWVALGYRSGTRLWDPQQIVLMRKNSRITDETVAAHLVAMYRKKFDYIIAQPPQSQREIVPVVLRTIQPRDCTAWRLTHAQLRRKARNIFLD